MKTKIKNLSSTQVELEVELSVERFDHFIDKAVSSLAKDMNLPGFRQGRIPKEVVMKQAGESTVLMEAAKLAVNDVYRKALLDNDLEPISPPKVDILKLAPQNPFSFRATFFVLPKFELPDYRELASKVKKEKISVKEKEIKDVLSLIQRSRADLKEVFRPAKKDDYVEIEFSCSQIQGNTKQKDAFVLGKGHLIPGFEDQLVGMSVGEEKTFSLDFPPDFYQKELANKQGDFQVKMTSVKEVELSEINDQFAQKVGKFKNLKELEKSIKKGLEEEKTMVRSRELRDKIMEKIEQVCQLDVPQVLVDSEKQRRFEDLKKAISNQGITLEQYFQKIKKTEQEVLKLFEQQARKQAKRFLILREIARKEAIEVEEEELKEEINKILARYPDLDTVKKNIDLENLKRYTEEMLRNEKVFQFLEHLTKEE